MAGVVALALVVRLAWDSGGYFPADHLPVGAIAFVVLAILLAVSPPRFAVGTSALVAVAALAGLAAWTGLSASWSSAPDGALADAQRLLAELGIFGLALLAGGTGRFARWLVWGVLAVVTLIAAAALVSRLYPDLIAEPLADPDFSNYRLGYPFGYWNTLGGVAAIGLVLAVGLAGDPRGGRMLRGLAAGAGVVIAATLWLTLSRGGWLAVIAGFVALLVLGAHRASLGLAFGLVGAGAMLVIQRLEAAPALTDDPSAGAGQLAAGHDVAPQILVIALVVGAAQALLVLRPLSAEALRDLRRSLRPLAIATVVIGALVAGGAYVVAGDRAERFSSARVVDVRDWIDEQWDEFNRPAIQSQSGSARLTTARGTRSDLYRVAFDGFQARPLAGDGASGFAVRWTRDRRVGESVLDAHSSYVEALGELGLIGFALLVAFTAALLAAAVRSRLMPGALTRSQAAAAGAAVIAFAVHSGFDWDWEMPALTGLALVLAGALFPRGRRLRRRSAHRRAAEAADALLPSA